MNDCLSDWLGLWDSEALFVVYCWMLGVVFTGRLVSFPFGLDGVLGQSFFAVDDFELCFMLQWFSHTYEERRLK